MIAVWALIRLTVNKNIKGKKACIKCGACTSVCPVYMVSGRERYTARGKHHVVENLAVSKRTSAFDDLLSKCILCGACQEVCSRDLATEKLVVIARSAHSRLSGISFVKYLASRALTKPKLLSYLIATGNSFNRLLASRLPEESGLRLRLSSLMIESLPPVQASFVESLLPKVKASAAQKASQGTCSYFVGCHANYLQPEIGSATDRIVEKISGYHPQVPQGQTCCGMASYTSGDIKNAQKLARKNIVAFEGNDRPVLSSCASCYAHLSSYPDLFEGNAHWQKRAHQFAERLCEFSTYLNTELEVRGCDYLHGSANEQSVTYHDPCHLRFKHHITKAPRQLLSKVPSIVVQEFDGGPQCCGHGGLFNIAHPETSRHIAGRLMDKFNNNASKVIVSTCSGCLLQLYQESMRQKSNVEVVHLAILLEEYL